MAKLQENRRHMLQNNVNSIGTIKNDNVNFIKAIENNIVNSIRMI